MPPAQGGPPGGGGPPEGATGGAAGWRGRLPWIIAGAVVVLVLVGVGIFFLGRGAAASEDVFLEQAAAPGADPFTAPVSPEAVTTTTTAPADGPSPTSAGPFGGSGDNSVCNRDQLISFLTDPAKAAQAREWARIRQITVAQIPAYILSLTPTVLTSDIRVTNHGFKNGKAYSRQSVLQTGTAVLVDQYGEPVVRCRCGNPLLAPKTTKRIKWVGERWPGFDPNTIVVVVVATVPIFPTTTTTTTTTTPTTTTTTGPPATSPPTTGSSTGTAERAIQILANFVEECVIVLEYDAQPSSDPDIWIVTLYDDAAVPSEWSVNTATHDIEPLDEVAYGVWNFCPG